MEDFTLDLAKSASQNASDYFQRAKKAKGKLENLSVAYAHTQEKIKNLKEKPQAQVTVRAIAPPKQATEWYSRFQHFLTSRGKLGVAGKSASDNEFLVSKHLNDKDLFFHADIQGATALILKEGVNATDLEKQEAAQFAASYSRAWKQELGSVDVYAVGKDAVSKVSHGEYVPKGGFMIKGGRLWFRNTPLMLGISVDPQLGLIVVPGLMAQNDRERKWVIIVPGTTEKVEMAQQIHKKLLAQETVLAARIEMILPGPSSIIFSK